MAGSKENYPKTDEHRKSGDWNNLWDTFREIDPDFLEAYLNFRSVPQARGPLPNKVKELILIAVNASTTHMYEPGVRRHIQNALKVGATREEIVECLQLSSLIGIHAFNVGVPILVEEIGKNAD
ncbi:carboxymuconolactone decarboxylase family protein [Pelagibacterium luteolum]|uniref:Uncharacterized conserved protein YurZ, alkylhydroperoxidase/carboxymuconolactone decarboxylase family n=1 Tax=Pelagibacterium luteolum TaxID=440168 RepID=A0A1G7ZRS5_9HYPH|nr:carboxymuconolactone decarboxylase family protein [Pelagibacterium luteolum]SDH11375.1 Uncharacterized conserved protein YurZ, alkylhydroperoxidase/carboxymuconolactone decarboxylase family [Pelagibacterium luteolum]